MDAGDTESTCLSVFEFSSILPRWDIGGEEDGDPGDPEDKPKKPFRVYLIDLFILFL